MISFTGRPRRPPFLLMSSAQASYPALTHFACSEARPVNGKEPPILIGSPDGAAVFAGWLKAGDAITSNAKTIRRMLILPGFISLPPFLGFDRFVQKHGLHLLLERNVLAAVVHNGLARYGA